MHPRLSNSYSPQRIAGRFAKDGDGTLWKGARPRIGPWRHVHRADAFVLKQLSNTKNVIRVAHGDATVQAIGAHDDGNAACGFRSVRSLGFGDERAFWDSALLQVRHANTTFAECRIVGSASSSDYDRGEMALVQLKRVIEPGTQDRRWMS